MTEPGVPIYVSITGLRVYPGPLARVRFWRYAMASMVQAKGADGNLGADARKVSGVHHTLTVWRDKAAMKVYLTNGAHLQAMKAFHRVGTGSVYGYETEAPPSWEDAISLWREHGRAV